MIAIIIEEIDQELKISLMYIWIEVKEIIANETQDISEFNFNLSKIKMRKIANKFYSQFKNSAIPVKKIQSIYEKFQSVSIIAQDQSAFAVPYFFYQSLKSVNPPDYSELFNGSFTWIDLLSGIYEKTFSVKSKLTLADIKILRSLCYYKRTGLFNSFDFVDQKNFLFQTKVLSKISKISYRWTIDRLNYLVNNYILQAYFILNPFLFGLQSYILTYNRIYDDQLSHLNQITLFKLDLNYDVVLRVIQVPNIENMNELGFSFQINIYSLKEMHMFNNLKHLSNESDKSFKTIPNFYSAKPDVIGPIIEFKEYFTKEFLSNFQEIEDAEKYYPILFKMSELRRTSIFIRVLNYLAQWGTIQGNLRKASKELRINPLEFLETCKFLFNNDIIGFFPRISRIGCNNRYGILIIDKEKNQSLLLHEIYKNFLELPVSVMFLNEDILFAYVAMPDSYVGSFIKYLNSFHEKIDIKYNNFVALKSWGRFSIPLPEGTTIDEFGINFPQNMMGKLNSES